MSTQLKLRRGTTAQHSTFTGAEGEVTVDTTKDTLVVHDGTTAGGKPVLTEANPSYTGTLTGGTGVVNLGSGQVYKDAAGNVGIGTSSPSARLEAVAGTGSQAIGLFRTGDATAANNSGGGFNATSSATAGSRNARLWLDADGANFGGSDYFYIDKAGNSGDVAIIQQSNAAMTFQTNGTERARIDSSGQMHTTNGAGVVAKAYDCRAWVNFNGTGTVAIRASGNVSSITDRGTGQYTVNFTTSMSDANYSAIATSDQAQTRVPAGVSVTTALYPIDTETSSGAYNDAASIYSAVFR